MAKKLDISDLSIGYGFIIQGDPRLSYTGESVSKAGDINGDGIDDLVVGAPGANDGAGAAYVIFGRDVSGGAVDFANIDLSALDPADGFLIQGDAADDFAGASVSGAGDVNGDGIDDLIVGAWGGDGGGDGAGEAYVIFGRDVAGGADAFGTIDLSALDPADGFLIQGDAAGDAAGGSVSAAGDVNGDGIGDLIVGALYGDDGARDAGEAYVIFGRDVAGGAAAFSTIDLSTLDASDGFIIQGDGREEFVGVSVSNAGDVNGDGIDDLIVGAYAAGASGEAYVIFGRDVAGGADALDDIDLSALDRADGFTFVNTQIGASFTGYSVSAAGDVNGDGIADVIIGAGRGSADVAAAYVVFGRDVDVGAAAFDTIDLAVLDPADGFAMMGDLWDDAGSSVSAAGDVNGDGIGDILVGAPYGEDNSHDGGEAYVVFGRDLAGGAAPFGTIDLSKIDPADGFILRGAEFYDQLGTSVSAAGDVNGDGVDDFIVGAPGAGEAYYAGEAYVIYGIPLAVELRGNANANTLEGTTNHDTLRGHGGDDLLAGLLGDDLLRGGSGNDELVGGAGNDTLVGNLGEDTLTGGLDRDRLEGRGGGDSLDGGDGNDLLNGGLGADTLTGGAGADRLNGGRGQDLLEGGDGVDRFFFGAVGSTPAGAGDTIADFETGERIYLGHIDADATSAGTNEAFTWLGRTAFTSTAGELRYQLLGADAVVLADVDGDGVADLEITLTGVDFLTWTDFDAIVGPTSHDIAGSASANAIYGDIFDDTLRGHGGDDTIDGGSGDDLLRGNAGNDVLEGGFGADLLYGNQGDDTMNGGIGTDTLYGGAGNDVLRGRDDLLYGGSGDDLMDGSGRMYGNAGNDTLDGYRSADVISGGGDNDLIHGDSGRDRLRGNGGADVIYGEGDKDWIWGGLGQDTLSGGDRKDRFLYGTVDDSPVGAGDTITDFKEYDYDVKRDTPDLIHLLRIDADATTAGTNEAFSWIADAAFSGAAGELRYEVTGADALVQGDVDGDGVADLEITLIGVSVLSATDFVL